MEVNVIVGVGFITVGYLILGSLCLGIWSDAIGDIPTKVIRVATRFGILLLWPLWLLSVAFFIAIGMIVLFLKEMFE